MLFFITECMLILLAMSPILVGIVFCILAIHRIRIQKKRWFKIRAANFFVWAVISFLLFPAVNLTVGYYVEVRILHQMQKLIGASAETFLSIFGQPDTKYETTWYYFNISPWYSLKPLIYDEDIVILVERGKIVSCILAD